LKVEIRNFEINNEKKFLKQSDKLESKRERERIKEKD